MSAAGWVKRARLFVRPLLRRPAVEGELAEELGFHLEMETARLMAAEGLDRDEARRRALIAFGGVEKVKEECREARLSHRVEGFFHDLRHAVRSLAGSPGFTAAAVLTLALGVGANTAIWSAVHAVLLKPLPYADGDRLVVVSQEAGEQGIGEVGFSVPEIEDYRDFNQTFLGLVEYHSMWFNLLGRGEPLRVQTGVVSAEFFALLGVKPRLGRSFAAADAALGAEPVLVLSHPFWERAFGADPAIVGETVEMNDRVHTVVGVLPPVPQYPDENDVYMPTSACPFRSSERARTQRQARGYQVFGRLGSGITAAEAEADLAALAGRLAGEHPDAYPQGEALEVRVRTLREELTANAWPTLWLLVAMVGLVLLAAIANVANLSLARLLSRRHEFALRAALGAERGRLTRQLLVESCLLALAAGLLGTLLALAGVDLLARFVARFTPRAVELAVDGWALAFTLALSLAAGLAVGALAAWRLFQGNLDAELREGGERATEGCDRLGLRRALVVAQVAVSALLLIAAGLTLRSLYRLQQVDPGFDPEDVLALRIDLDWARYGGGPDDDKTDTRDFWQPLLAEIRALPGVVSAALTSDLPMGDQLGAASFEIEGRPVPPGQPRPHTEVRVASPGYFETLGVPLLAGRAFGPQDHRDAPQVAVASESLARAYWGEESPVGQRIVADGGGAVFTIVGVVGDIKQYGPAREAVPEIYLAFPQSSGLSSRLVLRAAVPPRTLIASLRARVHALDPAQPIADIRTLSQLRRAAVASPRLTASLLGLFAALALVMTLSGIVGLLAFSVARRRREIGVRMALGAPRGRVLAMVLRQGLAMVGGGLAVGLAVGLGTSHLLAGLLFEVAPTDPLTFLAVAALLAAAAALACLVPARRATAIDPMAVLRNE